MKIIYLLLILLGSCEMETQGKEDKYIILRKGMVETIQKYGMRDPQIIKVMEKVPRHEFVPEEMQKFSYDDGPLPIGEGQTISQPFIVAYMTEKLRPSPSVKVLEIGTGSGYQAAVLGELSKEVYSIEIHKPLCTRSEEIIKKLGYKNIFVKCGDGYLGWPEKAPFDRIILTAAPAKIPQPLIDQLAPNGILIAPVGVGYQELQILEKDSAGKISKDTLLPVRFVPMTGKAEKE